LGQTVERPLRQEVKNAIAKVMAEAEALKLPRDAYAWHRRFFYGIDLSVAAAERRARNESPFTRLHRSAEMAAHWLHAQGETGSHRESLLGLAWGIHQELTT